jgi:PKD repeat protein
MQYIKSVLWKFGDGRSSTEYNPVHTYVMPGIYTWILVVTDLFGRTIRTTGTIRVWDWGYTNDALHVAYTTKCYRFAIANHQGVGGVEWTGDNWIWPTAYTGTCKGLDDAGNTISLVLNNSNGRFYRIGLRDIWEDRIGTYGGYPIECSFRLKEHTAVAGEYEEIEHIESHVHMRPFWEENRNQSGYDENGFLDDYAVTLKMYENGEPTTPSAKINQVPRYGDYVFRKRVEARRLQLEVIVDTSGWRCIKVQQQMMSINKAAGPGFDTPTEDTWQGEFATPDLWWSRDHLRPMMDRSVGTVFSGTHDTFGIGPDGYTNSALNFAAGQGMYGLNKTYLTGDMTLSLWVGNIIAVPITLWRMNVDDGNTLTVQLIQIGADYAVRWNDGTNGDTRTLAWNGVGWVHIAVEKSGTTLRIFENGVQLSATPLVDATLGYGGTIWFYENSILTGFDARRNNRAISAAALAYYYDDVINNNGNGGLLPIRR